MTTPTLDLDALLPDPSIVKFKGHTLKLPADVPIPTILEYQKGLRDYYDSIAGVLDVPKDETDEQQRERTLEQARQQEAVLKALHDGVLDLFRDGGTEEKELLGLRLSVGQIDRIFAFAITGDAEVENLAEAVVDTVTGGATDESPDPPEGNRAERRATAKSKKPRSASKKPASARS